MADAESLRQAALTPREREVLSLIAQGRSNAAIAATLFITPKVAEKHIASIFDKLGLFRRILRYEFRDTEIIAVDLASAVEKGNYSCPNPPRKPDPPRYWGTGELAGETGTIP